MIRGSACKAESHESPSVVVTVAWISREELCFASLGFRDGDLAFVTLGEEQRFRGIRSGQEGKGFFSSDGAFISLPALVSLHVCLCSASVAFLESSWFPLLQPP